MNLHSKSNQPLNSIVLKVGGNFFDDTFRDGNSAQTNFFKAVAALKQKGHNVAIVHGGGSQLQTQLTALGFKSEKHEGLRISPDEQMPAVTGVLAGTLNKQMVCMAAQEGLVGVGISLADGNLAVCDEVAPMLGAVGYPNPRSAKLLHQLMHANLTPIICSIGSDLNGRLYNVNADQAATCIASLLYADLYLLSDVSGVLDDNKQVIAHLDEREVTQLVDKSVITDGMIVKVRAAQEASKTLGKAVNIGSWNDISALLSEPETKIGTTITAID
ncbi:acetylglutamate kinase [Glaciecola sp. MF2-115]|uniref:acetylglutamate kinase n=1 Tax=Glaciecola sp. MF2-115 TaxID=3384827 RepID=UPI0039A361B7